MIVQQKSPKKKTINKMKDWDKILREIPTPPDSDAEDELNIMSVQRNAQKVSNIMHHLMPNLDSSLAGALPRGMNRPDDLARELAKTSDIVWKEGERLSKLHEKITKEKEKEDSVDPEKKDPQEEKKEKKEEEKKEDPQEKDPQEEGKEEEDPQEEEKEEEEQQEEDEEEEKDPVESWQEQKTVEVVEAGSECCKTSSVPDVDPSLVCTSLVAGVCRSGEGES